MWVPTRLARERVEFHYRDDTAGVANYGPFRASIQSLHGHSEPPPCYGGQ